MHLYFETERLSVRQYVLSDIDALFRLMSDIRVHIYTKDKDNPWSIQRTEEYIKCIINKDLKNWIVFTEQ